MNDKIKRKWVEALRSDTYKQGSGGLRQVGCYCCLGVLCELYRQEFPKLSKWTKEGKNNYFVFHTEKEENDSLLTPAVREWAELKSESPTVKNQHLTFLNDNEKTFTEIAELIDKNL